MAWRCGPESIKDFMVSSVVQTVEVQKARFASRSKETPRLPSAALAWRDERIAKKRKGKKYRQERTRSRVTETTGTDRVLEFSGWWTDPFEVKAA